MPEPTPLSTADQDDETYKQFADVFAKFNPDQDSQAAAADKDSKVS